MARTAQKTAETAWIIIDAIEDNLPPVTSLNMTAGKWAHAAMRLSHRLLRARTLQGGTEVRLLDEAAEAAMAARRACRHIQETSQGARERLAADVMINLAEAVIAFWGKRDDDGAHDHIDSLQHVKFAEERDSVRRAQSTKYRAAQKSAAPHSRRRPG